MFEKEAKERARKLEESQNVGVYDDDEDLALDIGWNKGEVAGYEEGFRDGAEFGYNKANEWHFVSKEGFPNKDDIYLIIRSDGLHLGDYCYGGDGDIDCQSWCDYPSEEEIQDDSIIAWKEIVTLNESE